MVRFKHANQSTKIIGDCLCGMSATHTLSIEQRLCRHRKCRQGSSPLSRLRANGWPTSNSRNIPKTLFLARIIRPSESRQSCEKSILEGPKNPSIETSQQSNAILPSMQIAYLECTRCREQLPADRPQNVCPKDGGVLFARYDLASLKGKLRPQDLSGRVASMWRYAEVLPDAKPVTLGEGFTPLLPSREYAGVFIKDEGLNPTGSFKARGMSVSV